MVGRTFGILGAVFGALVVAAVFTFLFVARKYRVPSAAMEPTLHCPRPASGCRGDHADRFVVFTFLGYGRGDLVVFQVPERAGEICGTGGTYVKRIIGMPGDTWEERRGSVYVNGRKLDEPYVEKSRRDFQTHAARKVRPDTYFVMGDNRSQSCDSRSWGTVPRDLVIGKVFARYWPPGRVHVF